jgi:hypothetical protein
MRTFNRVIRPFFEILGKNGRKTPLFGPHLFDFYTLDRFIACFKIIMDYINILIYDLSITL